MTGFKDKKNKPSVPPPAVRLTDVSKQYEIHHEKPTLVERFVNSKNERFWALKNINLTVLKGERVGIIGMNGSGKTTLLKIICGICTPTSGSVITEGKIVSLIDLNAGFHEELTGYQNIFINGLLLGMSHRFLQEKTDFIIDFADIHQFIDTPIYTYSSGMILRLGFAIAIASDPDILIVDEGMSVGDLPFREKAYDYLRTHFADRTVISVSHDFASISALTRRAIWLDRGAIVCDDDTENVLSAYYRSNTK